MNEPYSTVTTVQQRGSVLIVSMLILLVMTLLGITAMSTTTLEEKMAGNVRDHNIAFQAAEAALRDGEADLTKNNIAESLFVAACTNGLCLPAAVGSPPQWEVVDWGASGTTTRKYGVGTGAAALAGVAMPPRYIIELLRDIPSPNGSLTTGISAPKTKTAFRITAVGYGANAATTVVLQAVVVKL